VVPIGADKRQNSDAQLERQLAQEQKIDETYGGVNVGELHREARRNAGRKHGMPVCFGSATPIGLTGMDRGDAIGSQ
jgi:hypothetical protein